MMPGLFASSERQAKRKRLNDPLWLLSQTVDFASIARSLDGHLRLGTSAKGDARRGRQKVMVRLLLLQQAGLVARGGQLIDASIIRASVQRNTRRENAQLKQDISAKTRLEGHLRRA